MTVAILASSALERQSLVEALGGHVRVPVLSFHPDRLESALVREDLAVAVVEHAPGLDGLELAADVLRCRPGIHVVLVATGGDELLAAEAIKRGLADYVPRARIDRLGASVRALLAARPDLSPE